MPDAELPDPDPEPESDAPGPDPADRLPGPSPERHLAGLGLAPQVPGLGLAPQVPGLGLAPQVPGPGFDPQVPGPGPDSATPALADSTIAVSGATGFLASYLLLHLLPQGTRVVALVRKPPYRAMASLALALRSAGAPAETVQRVARQVHAVQISLDRPRLGLSEGEFQAVADSVDAVLHCAALTKLHGDAGELHRTNVEGTRQILALAAAGRRAPHLFHVSTAFVAGARLDGLVPERQLEADGFLTPYEESKHRAERLVHDWARTQGRGATVFRPSVLLSDRTALPRAPQHTYAVLAAKLALFLRHGPRALVDASSVPLDASGRLTIRLLGAPDASINLLQVDDAARAMLRIADQVATQESSVNRPDVPPGARVHHIVHPTETSVTRVNEALQRSIPWLRLALVPERPSPSGLERAVDLYGAEATAYLGLRRRYERTSLCELERRRLVRPPAPVDNPYLDAALTPPLMAR
ncbi:SDR family oxidoreductase [Streptomyces sp. NPDC059863]|uniref:SDR family oxidoreductase n=1 Tax=unclassified Streptomyces TaxID=2593676 RepID=UPI00366788CF